jgi:hypothetical protein
MQYREIKYIPETEDPSITIETEQLIAKVIDNTGLLTPFVKSTTYMSGSHRVTPFSHHLGYHGIRTLYNKTEKRNLVAPFFSWLNLQGADINGINCDPVDERAWAGVGRGWPIRMESKDKGVLLSLNPLPSMQMLYSLEIQPAEPDAFDFSVRFKFARKSETGPIRFRASWPFYMNAYDDVRLFFPKGRSNAFQWESIGERPDIVLGETVNYKHVQKGFYAENQALTMGYGLIGDHVLIIMANDPRVRHFVVNAGGHLSFSPVQNPAWDFEWIIENYPLNQLIGFDGRLIYTKFKDQEQVLNRYYEWIDTKKQ